MLSSFVVFTIFTMACALAPNWPVFLVFRLICGFMASSPIAVVGGLYADIFDDPVVRGRAMAVFMAVRQNMMTLFKNKADFVAGYNGRSSNSSKYIRLCISRNLALDVLGGPDRCGSIARLPPLPSGDLRSYNPKATGQKNAQRDR